MAYVLQDTLNKIVKKIKRQQASIDFLITFIDPMKCHF